LQKNISLKINKTINIYKRILLLLIAFMLFPFFYAKSTDFSIKKTQKSIKKEFSISQYELEKFIFENPVNEFEIFPDLYLYDFTFLNFEFLFQNLLYITTFIKSTNTLYDLFCCLKIDC
jgi:hypothetical protein